MISRRNLLIAGAAVPFLSYAHIPAFAATPKDILVVAQQAGQHDEP